MADVYWKSLWLSSFIIIDDSLLYSVRVSTHTPKKAMVIFHVVFEKVVIFWHARKDPKGEENSAVWKRLRVDRRALEGELKSDCFSYLCLLSIFTELHVIKDVV